MAAASREAGLIKIQTKVQDKDNVNFLQYYKNILRLQQIESLSAKETTEECVVTKRPRRDRSDLYELLDKACESCRSDLDGDKLVWQLRPRSYESLCDLHEMYRTGVLDKALEKDVRQSACYPDINQLHESVQVEVCMQDQHLKACLEELALGEPLLSSLTSRPATSPGLSREECVTCVRRLAERHLLVTSPHIAPYLRCHESLLLKLGHVAFTQYVTKEHDLEETARNLGYCLQDDDIDSSGFITASPSSAKSSFHSDDLKAWLAAYYVVHKDAKQKLEALHYHTTRSFSLDMALHHCLVNFDNTLRPVLVARLGLPCFTIHEVNALSKLLDSSPSPNDGHEINEEATAIGKLMTTCSQCNVWSLSNMAFNLCDIDAMHLAIGQKATQVTDILLSFNPLHGAGSSLGRLMVAMPSLKRLDLCKTGLQAQDIADMVAAIGDVPLHAANVFLHQNDLQDAGSDLGRLMVALPQCIEWDFSMVNLITQDVTDMAEAIGQEKLQAKTMSLSSLPLRGAGAAVGRLMAALPLVTDWNLSRTCLTADDMAQIVASLTEKETGATGEEAERELENRMLLATKKLDLASNSLHDGGASLGKLLLVMPECQYLQLGVTMLGSGDVSTLAEAIQGTRLYNMQEIWMQGNNLNGSGLPLGRLMTAMPSCRLWDLSSTHLESYDFSVLARAVGDNSLKTETLLLDGSEEFYGDEDQATFAKIMPDCRIRYTNQNRGKTEEVPTPPSDPVQELELEIPDTLLKSTVSVLGLPDLGCVLAGEGPVIRLDRQGHLLGSYDTPDTAGGPSGMFVHKQMLFILQHCTICQVALDQYQPSQNGGKDREVKRYEVPEAECLSDGLFSDDDTLVLLDIDQCQVMEFKLSTQSSRVVVEEIGEVCSIAKHMEGHEPTYFIAEYSLYVTRVINVYSATWERIREIQLPTLPTAVVVTPEHTILVAHNYVSEYSLEGAPLRDILDGDCDGDNNEDEILSLSLCGRHIWCVTHCSLTRYALYEYDFEEIES